jgi:hypothetical protein
MFLSDPEDELDVDERSLLLKVIVSEKAVPREESANPFSIVLKTVSMQTRKWQLFQGDPGIKDVTQSVCSISTVESGRS